MIPSTTKIENFAKRCHMHGHDRRKKVNLKFGFGEWEVKILGIYINIYIGCGRLSKYMAKLDEMGIYFFICTRNILC